MPETVASELQAIEKKLAVILTPHHIILYGALAVALFVGVYFFQGKRVSEAEGREAVATAVAAQAKDDAAKSAKDNATLQASLALQISQLQDANKSLTTANETLASAMKAEAAALMAQQKVNASSTPTEQANRWRMLVPVAKVVSTSSGFEVDAVGGLATLQELEKVPVLTTQLGQANQTIGNLNTQVTNDATILQKEKDSHAADVANDGKQLVASQTETKKVQAEFDTYKKKARRNIMRAYVAGIVTGVVIKKFFGF